MDENEDFSIGWSRFAGVTGIKCFCCRKKALIELFYSSPKAEKQIKQLFNCKPSDINLCQYCWNKYEKLNKLWFIDDDKDDVETLNHNLIILSILKE